MASAWFPQAVRTGIRLGQQLIMSADGCHEKSGRARPGKSGSVASCMSRRPATTAIVMMCKVVLEALELSKRYSLFLLHCCALSHKPSTSR